MDSSMYGFSEDPDSDSGEFTTVQNAKRKAVGRANKGLRSRPSRADNVSLERVNEFSDSRYGELNAHLSENFRRPRRAKDRDPSPDERMSSIKDQIRYTNAIREYVAAANALEESMETESWVSKPEIPTTAELFNNDYDEEQVDGKHISNLPENVIDGPWESKQAYLSAHYALMREDAVRPLREAIQEIRKHPGKMEYELSKSTIGLYDNIYITGITFAPRGVATRVVFSLGRIGKRIHWEQSKRLLTGSLVALTPVDDMFATKCVLAVVAARPLAGLEQNPPEIDLYFARPADQELDCQKEWVMVEERAGFFEAERHTLRALQKLANEPFPLQEHLIDLERVVQPPDYLAAQPNLNMRTAFTSGDFSNTDVLTKWPEEPASTLDKFQRDALRRILTKRLAVVQGPPGTGKTHVSVIALKVMIDNMSPDDPPIIVTCQTNHALDQLLRHIATFEPEFARVGGRSKDRDVVKKRTLFELKKGKPKSGLTGGLRVPAIKRMRMLAESTSMLLSPLEFGKGLQDHQILFTLGLITQEQADSLTNGDTEYTTHGIKSLEKSQIHIWLGKLLGFSKAKHMPVDIGFEYEETDLEFEQLKEQEAENLVQEDEEDWETLKGSYVSIADNFTGKGPTLPQAQIDALLKTPNLWKIPLKYRGSIFSYWQKRVKQIILDRFREEMAKYNALAEARTAGRWEEDAVLLANQKVIGLTTTGFSKNRALLYALKPKVVLIEEAAETLEAPVIAACLPSLEHLILVGDHQQLRPHTHVKALEHDPYNLNVSLFERLVRNGLEFTMLKRQRRMIPEIRRILKPIYGRAIKDHQSVKDVSVRPPVPGMGGVSSFFFTHEWPESHDDTMSALNINEAEMIVGFYKYLIFNGMKDEDITVLTFYNGQRKKILRLLRSNDELVGRIFKVVTVDSYQGEENKVVLLSLVRSNSTGQIGFLRVDNRVCVALSRAKCGFYIFGNAEMLCGASKTWAEIVAIMWGKDSEAPDIRSRRIGYHLPLQCSNHKRMTWIHDPFDWKVNYGGCMTECKGTLPCGHKCLLRCHPFSHESTNCPQICGRVLACSHTCAEVCSDQCRCAICGSIGTPVSSGESSPTRSASSRQTRASGTQITNYDSLLIKDLGLATATSAIDDTNIQKLEFKNEAPTENFSRSHMENLNMAETRFGTLLSGTQTEQREIKRRMAEITLPDRSHLPGTLEERFAAAGNTRRKAPVRWTKLHQQQISAVTQGLPDGKVVYPPMKLSSARFNNERPPRPPPAKPSTSQSDRESVPVSGANSEEYNLIDLD